MRRGLSRPPGGESMGECQVRAVRAVERMCAAHPDAAVAAVTHADVVKVLLCHWLGVDLGLHHRLQVDPASVSTAVVGEWGVKVLRINAAAGEPRP